MKAIAAILLGAASLAQEPLREGSFGEVRGADKKPFAGATVHLLHRAHPGVLDPAYEDHVVATADERGQFKVQLLVGMPYAVWAVGPVVDGTYRCSEVISDIVPGVPIVLHEGELHYVRKLTIAVDASWPHPLTFAARAVVGRHTLVQALPLVDHRAELPPWPVADCWLLASEGGARVFDVDIPMTLDDLRIRAKQLEDAQPPPDDAALRQALTTDLAIKVGARRDFAVKFVDADKQPIAGVDVSAESPLPRERLGVTSKDGVLRAATARPEGAPAAIAEVVGAAVAETRVDGDAFNPVGEEPKAVPLAPGVAMQGRLLLAADRPLARAPVLLDAAIKLSENSTWFGLMGRVLQTADDGGLVVPGRVQDFPFRLTALLTPQQRAALSPQKTAPPLWPRAIVQLEHEGKFQPIGDVRLDQLASIDVQVFAADHSPPGAVQLIAMALCDHDNTNWPHSAEQMVSDRHGRLRFLAPADCELAVFAVAPNSAAFAIATPARRSLQLTLDPRHATVLRIIDDAGKPLAGARVNIVVTQDDDATGDATRVAAQVRSAYFMHVFPWHEGTTDGNGVVQLIDPVLGLSLDLEVYCDGYKPVRKTVKVPADRGSEPIELVLMPSKG